MATNRLTALRVERAHRKGKPIVLGDGDGLYLRKQTSDGATWTLRYRFAGRERWLALGNYPDMPLAQARSEARNARVLLDKQQDPLTVKRATVEAERRRGPFRDLCEDWYRVEVQARKLKHPEVPRRYLDNYLLPQLGRIPVADVHPSEIARMLDKVRGAAPTAANDLLRFTKRIFAFAVRRHAITGNPASDFTPQHDAGGTEKARTRALDREELIQLFEAIRKAPTFGGDNLLALKLLLTLCVRKGELLAAKWTEFDIEGDGEVGPVWRLPKTRSKTNTGLDIPLVPEVVGWLKTLKVLAAGSEYVFPQRRRDPRQRYQHVGLDTLNVALTRVEHGLEAFTLHDLRRTARTHLAALGVRREVAERCLGHRLSGVEGTYNTHDYFEERRAALLQWTALVTDAEHGRRKVTPIRRKGS
jgi:integrase